MIAASPNWRSRSSSSVRFLCSFVSAAARLTEIAVFPGAPREQAGSRRARRTSPSRERGDGWSRGSSGHTPRELLELPEPEPVTEDRLDRLHAARAVVRMQHGTELERPVAVLDDEEELL